MNNNNKEEYSTNIYSNSTLKIYVNYNSKILYVEVLDGTYNKDNFLLGIEYFKNLWLLINNTDDKYYQVFIFNNAKVYPLEFYTMIFTTLKNLEEIFKKNLIASFLVNDSDAINLFRPLLNMYNAVKPFSFVKTYEEGINFFNRICN